VNLQANKELLGMWTQNESAKFWLSILTELQNRGLKDIFIACCDGLTGLPMPSKRCFPKPRCNSVLSIWCETHSLTFPTKTVKAVAADLRRIYRLSYRSQAEQQLVEFAEKWDKAPDYQPSLDEPLDERIPFFAFPPEIRRAIYTTQCD
jgi:transposase-like protein